METCWIFERSSFIHSRGSLRSNVPKPSAAIRGPRLAALLAGKNKRGSATIDGTCVSSGCVKEFCCSEGLRFLFYGRARIARSVPASWQLNTNSRPDFVRRRSYPCGVKTRSMLALIGQETRSNIESNGTLFGSFLFFIIWEKKYPLAIELSKVNPFVADHVSLKFHRRYINFSI